MNARAFDELVDAHDKLVDSVRLARERAARLEQENLALLAEIDEWKNATGLECGGDPDAVTPKAARAYWENIERIANQRDDAVNSACNLRQDLELAKLQLRRLTAAHNDIDWRPYGIDIDGEMQWYVVDDSKDPHPVAIVPRGEETANQIAHAKAMSHPWWGAADEYWAALVERTLRGFVDDHCRACNAHIDAADLLKRLNRS